MHLRKMYILAFGWKVLHIAFKFIPSNISFKNKVSLLIPCLDVVSRLLNSLIILLSISPFRSPNICLYIQVLQCWVHKYLQILHHTDGLTPLSLCNVLLCLLIPLILDPFCLLTYPTFLLVSICKEHLFQPFNFGLKNEVSLLKAAYRWFYYFFNSFSYSVF